MCCDVVGLGVVQVVESVVHSSPVYVEAYVHHILSAAGGLQALIERYTTAQLKHDEAAAAAVAAAVSSSHSRKRSLSDERAVASGYSSADEKERPSSSGSGSGRSRVAVSAAAAAAASAASATAAAAAGAGSKPPVNGGGSKRDAVIPVSVFQAWEKERSDKRKAERRAGTAITSGAASGAAGAAAAGEQLVRGADDSEAQQLTNRLIFDMTNEVLQRLVQRPKREPWHASGFGSGGSGGLGGNASARLADHYWQPPTAAQVSACVLQLFHPPASAGGDGKSQPDASAAPPVTGTTSSAKIRAYAAQPPPLSAAAAAAAAASAAASANDPLGLDAPEDGGTGNGEEVALVDAILHAEQQQNDSEWLDYGTEEERVVFEIADSILYDMMGGVIADLNAVEAKQIERQQQQQQVPAAAAARSAAPAPADPGFFTPEPKSRTARRL
jgi:hypothetical protein